MQLRRYRYKLKVRGKGKEQKLWKFAGAYRLINRTYAVSTN